MRRAVRHLILGAGISGLALAHFMLRRGVNDLLILEKEAVTGGLCRSFSTKGFVWACSGHFLHFKDPETKTYVQGIVDDEFLEIQKRSFIQYGPCRINFPFQRNIHQLPKEEFIDCLVGLFDRTRDRAFTNFKDMLLHRYGDGICKRFLFPYNEKVYACDLTILDVDAMGRFFPHVSADEIVRSLRRPDEDSYNARFSYPRRGISSLVHAFEKENDRIRLNEEAIRIDPVERVVLTNKGHYYYENLISTVPLNRFLPMLEMPADGFTYNRVLVFNFGFDRPATTDAHWIYYADRGVTFYRVGFYSNITQKQRMSLYVEIGVPATGFLDMGQIRRRALMDLERVGVITDHVLVAENHVIIDPAYCHLTSDSERKVRELAGRLELQGIFLTGRYSRWTYSSIEDNIISSRSLSERLITEFNARGPM